MRPERNGTMNEREAWEIIEALREISDELKAIREILEPEEEKTPDDEEGLDKYII